MVVILVKPLKGDVISVNVKMSDSINDVKAKLSEKLRKRVPFLIFAGKQLTGYEKVFGYLPVFEEGGLKKQEEKVVIEEEEDEESSSSGSSVVPVTVKAIQGVSSKASGTDEPVVVKHLMGSDDEDQQDQQESTVPNLMHMAFCCDSIAVICIFCIICIICIICKFRCVR